MASAAVYQYSPIQKFGNGMISGSFVTKNKGPMRIILRDVVLPMGVQNYDSKWSALVSLGTNPIEELNELHLDVCQYLGAPFKIACPVRDVVWFKKGQEGGITLKALQVKMLENQDHEERQTNDSAVCSI